MRRCKSCGCPLPADSAPQRRYCDPTEHPDCKRQRDDYRKAHERARAFNAYTQVVNPGESPEPAAKRQTSSTWDEKGEHDWDSLSGMWQAIRQAWFPLDGNPLVKWRVLPASRGPEMTASEVDRLMRRVEGTRPAVGQLRDSSWVDPEDRNSPGELWLRGERDRAIAMAERAQARTLRQCEALPDGYLQGGQLWDGMHLSPRRRESEEAPPRTRLSRQQRDQLGTSVRRARGRVAAKDPSPDVCDSVMRANRGLG